MSDLKCMLGMSGGVDSSVSADLLINEGFSVAGVTLSLCENDERNISDAKSVCERLGIKHFSFDLKNDFKRYVIDSFANSYIIGETPNPCLECNKHIKFGKMIEIALENGYEKIATGHYARIKKREDGRYLLFKAKDLSKDQSYVLYMLNQYQLSKTLLPLGELTKAEVREIAAEKGFVNADRPDSQDICFVPDGEYADFIESKTGFKSQEGEYTDINGKVLGKHKGIINYTLGQRKGLGIALGKPAFVIDKNADTNRVILGDEEYLFKTRVVVDNVNFIPFDKLENEMRVTAKLRYRHNAEEAILRPIDENTVMLEFAKPQRAASPGQAAVFYDGDMVIGGGKIVRAE